MPRWYRPLRRARAVALANVANVGCARPTIAGGVFEVAGFALVAYELARIQRREFGEPEFLKRLRLRLRRLLRRPVMHTAEAAGAIAVGGSVRATVRQGPGKTLDERVEALEENIRRFETEVDQDRVRLASEIEEVRAKLAAMRSELAQEHQKERRSARRPCELR